MARLNLPDPVTGADTSLRNASDAQAWVTAQAQAQPMRMLRAVLAEIQGIDASAIPALERVEMLDALRAAIVLAEEAIEVRYAHKPLPLLEEENKAFHAGLDVWLALSHAYLRTVPFLKPADAARPLHRAAVGLREALHCHYIGAQESDPELIERLFELLRTAESLGVERLPIPDKDYKNLGESSIVADVAWSFLLHFCDPYRFSAAQFTVANRALSRWRELSGFQTQPDDSAKARYLKLENWLSEEALSDGAPRYLEVRAVARKIRHRIEAIEEGETPEQLRLGRELPGPACIKLLRMLDEALNPEASFVGDALSPRATQVNLVFGQDAMYEALTGRPMEDAEASAKSDRLAHERIALFGFDNAESRKDLVKQRTIPSETWGAEDGWVLRAVNAGAQVLGPALVAIQSDQEGEAPRLAVLFGLRQTHDGWLMGTLRALPHPASTGIQRISNAPIKGMPLTPAFLIPEDKAAGLPLSVCLPTGSGARPGGMMALDRSSIEHLRLLDVIERGTNFVRFGAVRG